ncbi:MAG: metal ABC transporter permease, partial [Comamonas sp.]
PAMTLGGLGAGLAVAWLAGLVTRLTGEPEDASFAVFYLISLALGVLLISLRGSNADLLGVLFGSALSLDDPTLLLAAAVATASLAGLALIYRPLLVECMDPGFLRLQGLGWWVHGLFLLLLVLNLVGGFHALGTLMAVAFLILPAAAARLWWRSVAGQMAGAVAFAAAASLAGLLLSYHQGMPASPAIVLACGALYGASLLGGRLHSLRVLAASRARAPALP